MGNFDNKAILISGASSGMGAETAIQLSKRGARVAIVARRSELLKEVYEGLDGRGHRYYTQDLGKIDEIEELIHKVIEDIGPLDGFVNCVGIGEIKPLKYMNYEFNKQIMDINYFSFVEQLRCIVRRGNYNKPLSIVTISSASAVKGTPADTAYAATKGAMEAAVRCLSKELAHNEIRINTIAPGLVKTKLAEDFLQRGATQGKIDEVFKTQVLGMGQPVDIANAVMFLLSDESRFITGTTMCVDGGYTS